MPAPETITLVRDGQAADVPVSEAHAWISEGYAPEDDAARIERTATEAKDSAYGAAEGAALGGLRGLTLGGSDLLFRGIGGEDAAKQLSDIRKATPISSTIGNVVGSVAPALATGGGSLLASTPAGAVARLGSRIAGAGAEAGALTKAAAGAAGAAFEGAAQNVGAYISDVALGDKELAADGFTAAMGQGVLFGAPIGAALSLGASGLTAARRMFPKSEVTKEAVQQLETEAAQVVRSATDDAKAMKQAATDRLRQIREERAALDLTTQTELAQIAKAKAQELASLELAAAKARSEAAVVRAESAKARALAPKKGKRKAFGPDEAPAPTTAPAVADDLAPPSAVDDAVDPPLAPAAASPDAPVVPASAADVVDETETLVDPKLFEGRDIRWGDDFGKDKVKLDKARKVIADGQRDPVQISVSPQGRLSIDDGRHRLKAAIEAGKPVKVKWFKGSAGIDDVAGDAAGDAAAATATKAAAAPINEDEFGTMLDTARTAFDSSTKTALVDYTGKGMFAVNNKLREAASKARRRGAALEALDPKNQQFVATLDAAMAASPAPRDVVVFRGLKSGKTATRFQNAKVGQSILDEGYGSTSMDDFVGAEYAKGFGLGGGVRMRITVPEGYPIVPIADSKFAKEKELLLPRDTKYTITGKSVDDNGHTILDVTVGDGVDLSKIKVEPEAPAMPQKVRVKRLADLGDGPRGFEIKADDGVTVDAFRAKPGDIDSFLEANMPKGFNLGKVVDGDNFGILPGLPKSADELESGMVWAARPSDLAKGGARSADIGDDIATVQRAWDGGARVDPVQATLAPDGSIFVTKGSGALRAAAADDRPVALAIAKAADGWKPPADAVDVAGLLAKVDAPAVPASAVGRTLEEQLAATKQALDGGASLKQVGASRQDAIEDAMNRHIAKSDPEAATLVQKLDEMQQGQSALDSWLSKYPKGKVRAVEYANGLRKESGYANVVPDGEGSALLPRGRSSEWRGSVKDQDEAIGRFYDRQGGEEALAAGTKRWYPGGASTAEDIARAADADLESRVSAALKGATDDIEVDLDDIIAQIGRYETASADLAEALGVAAPPGAVGRAAGLREAQSAGERKIADAAARGVEDVEKATAAASLAGGKTKAGVFDRAADAGGMLEALQMMGVSVPDIGKIPVIGPVLSVLLKARLASKMFRRIGGKIPETAEGAIARKSAEVRDKVVRAVDAIVDGASKALPKAAHPATAAVVLGHKLFDDGEPTKRKQEKAGSLSEAYQARSDELDRAMQPGAIATALRARVRASDPEIMDQLVAAQERKLKFIDSKRPRPDQPPGLMAPRNNWVPSKVEVQQWARYVEAAENPTLVLERAAAGMPVSPEAAETLAAVYPRLFQEAQRRLVERSAELGATLPYARRVELSTLFGVPLDATMDPSYTSFLQEGYQAAPPPPQGQGPVMTPTITSDVNHGMRAAMPFDQGA